MNILKVTGLLLGMFLVTGSAEASTLDYTVTFRGPGFSGSGDIAVNFATEIVQAVTVNGVSVQVIAPNGSGLYTQPGTGLQWTYDDLFFSSGTPFDNAGLLLSFNNTVANIYSVGTQLYLSLSGPISDYNPGEQISMSARRRPCRPDYPCS